MPPKSGCRAELSAHVANRFRDVLAMVSESGSTHSHTTMVQWFSSVLVWQVDAAEQGDNDNLCGCVSALHVALTYILWLGARSIRYNTAARNNKKVNTNTPDAQMPCISTLHCCELEADTYESLSIKQQPMYQSLEQEPCY
jgi:hypothetical protein